jgi:hypothetical protein
MIGTAVSIGFSGAYTWNMARFLTNEKKSFVQTMVYGPSRNYDNDHYRIYIGNNAMLSPFLGSLAGLAVSRKFRAVPVMFSLSAFTSQVIAQRILKKTP